MLIFTQKEDTQEEPTSSGKTTTADDKNLTHKQTSGNDNTRETSNISCYLGFPLLLLPPQEHDYHGPKSQHRVLPTEDKIGTLHNNCADTARRGFKVQIDLLKKRQAALQSDFSIGPHTWENPKPKMEEAEEPSINVSGHNEPLIGPKLPELSIFFI